LVFTYEENAMSIHILKSITRSVPIAAVAVLVHVGSAAAGTPHYDYQQQVRNWLSGSVTTCPPARAETRGDDASRAEVDTQASVREFLSGSAILLAARSESTRNGTAESSDVAQDPRGRQAQKDFQASIRRLLQGERPSTRTAS
jgi:hypothetical protein